eukprot:CAMPEP_0206206642 /NCGR_PEP_ID=MMETSP0166-20121206/15088_1 /ASSEMBLY_ACC=CAM_ASM_000260 /TAXON_ID=95228 /ORGANISM="Vannella robusta, Strain DIVA3 518/3/11/1/6" /LENGTH=266 /DNA_ID=CAMNT_0053627193 /DNA_START=1 /DNA_END=798 /DNA_ORIENTATION=-
MDYSPTLVSPTLPQFLSLKEDEEDQTGSQVHAQQSILSSRILTEHFSEDYLDEEFITVTPQLTIPSPVHLSLQEEQVTAVETEEMITQAQNPEALTQIQDELDIDIGIEDQYGTCEGWNKKIRERVDIVQKVESNEVAPLNVASDSDGFDEFSSPRISYGSSPVEPLSPFRDIDEKVELEDNSSRSCVNEVSSVISRHEDFFSGGLGELSARSQQLTEVRTTDLKRSVKERDMVLSIELKKLVKQDPPLPAPDLFMKKWNLIRKRK